MVLYINSKKFIHQVNVFNELNDSIIAIHFIHVHKLYYDVQSCQVKISRLNSYQIVAIKESVLPTLFSSSMLNVKYKGKLIKDATNIATICSPRTHHALSGMTAIVTIDKNNNCKEVVTNCAPNDDRNVVFRIINLEQDNLIPMEDCHFFNLG